MRIMFVLDLVILIQAVEEMRGCQGRASWMGMQYVLLVPDLELEPEQPLPSSQRSSARVFCETFLEKRK